jgi:hypothetical protein
VSIEQRPVVSNSYPIECKILGSFIRRSSFDKIVISNSLWKSLDPVLDLQKTLAINYSSSNETSSVSLRVLAISASSNLENGFGKNPDLLYP